MTSHRDTETQRTEEENNARVRGTGSAGPSSVTRASPLATASAAACTVLFSVPSGSTMCLGRARAAAWIRARTSMGMGS